MTAERNRRALILCAEGEKRSQILKAEGAMQAQVLTAQGAKESRILEAEGEALAQLKLAQAESDNLAAVQKNMPNGDASAYLLGVRYIKALPEMMKGAAGKTVVIPYEASSLSSLTTVVKNMMEDKK